MTSAATTLTGPGHPGSVTGRSRKRGRSAEAVSYDFRRPIQLSREHSRMLQLAFDGFARQATTVLTSMLRTVCQVQLMSVDQRSYSEYVDSLLAPTYMTIFSAEPMPGRGVLELPLQATMSCIDHVLGGPGSGQQPVRALSDIESAVVSGLVERLLAEMRYSLGGIVALEPTMTGTEYSPQFAQVAGAADVMVVATLDVRINDRPFSMTVCLPFTGLQPHLVAAAAPAPVSDRERAQRAVAAELLQRQFDQVPLEVSVRLRSTTLSPADLRDLRPGDVVRLAHPASAPLDVTVEDMTFAHATHGVQGQRLAALIVGAPKENA